MSSPIYTIADIRKAIEGRADDDVVHNQVVAADGTTWLMACVISPVFNFPKSLVIDMRHPKLKTLPTPSLTPKEEQLAILQKTMEAIANGEEKHPNLAAYSALISSAIW